MRGLLAYLAALVVLGKVLWIAKPYILFGLVAAGFITSF
jgi:hypothetical protein